MASGGSPRIVFISPTTNVFFSVRLAPEDASLRWQWARALAAFDAKKYHSEIEAELQAALEIDPATELDRVMQGRAETLLEVVNTGKPREIEAAALTML